MESHNEECAEFIEMLLHSGTNAHLLHLQTKSYAKHKALDEFYHEIIDLADDFAEACQGLYGLITEYQGEYELPDPDPVKELKNLNQKVREMRKELPQDSELQNIVDEIQGKIEQTLYKLTFLS